MPEMNKLKLLYEVSSWEFKRWFKIKEHFISLLIAAALSFLIFGSKIVIELFEDKNIDVIVINSERLPFALDPKSKINLTFKNETDVYTQLTLLQKKEIDGIIFINSVDSIDLKLYSDAPWVEELRGAINVARQNIKLTELNISQYQLAELFKEVKLNLNYTEREEHKAGDAEVIAAGILMGLMFMGIFLGLSYQFIVITGEKQNRITEVVISAIPPQIWIDGKIIGIALLSLVSLISTSLSFVLFMFISDLFGSGWTIPLKVMEPLLIIKLFFFALGGFVFWNTFFSAIAATINDPNTSSRNSFLMIPTIPAVIGFLSLGDPNSIVVQIFSIFPITSSAVISARMVLTHVPLWEILLSFSLLILSTWYLRKLAGKIFATSILMYGKEPTWKEIFRWLKEKQK